MNGYAELPLDQPKSRSFFPEAWCAKNRMRLATSRAALGVLIAATLAPAYSADPKIKDLFDLSLEQLSNVEVTSVSRRAERLQDAAASIFVISADDIRRSGATSLPDALRIAPNLQIARVTSSSYAISSRGFNNSSGNKLLVLIDGRAVYTPLFSGVFWDAQDVMLEDVDRIEVISGPGATLWGANAVNGVINVVTRSARETQGTLATVGAGNREADGAMRHGGELESGGHYRIYGKYFNRENTERGNGSPVADDWAKGQAGFRADWGDTGHGVSLQGNAYRGKSEQSAPGMQRVSGVNLLARWNRELAGGSEIHVQAYYDRTQRTIPGTFAEHLDIFDLEFQHALQPAASHQVLWGAGYRYAFDRVDNSAGLAFLPADRNLRWANLFVQDQIALRSNLGLTLGVKGESNIYTGVEWLPSARLSWKLATNHMIWGAVSRGVRAPSRLDRELFAPATPPFLLAGGPNFKSEVSKVFELGYRAQPTSKISYSITAFRHIYDRLRSIEPTSSGAFVLDNKMEGNGNGVEGWGSYQVTPAWRLSAGFVELRQQLGRSPGSLDPTGPSALGNDPKHQWQLRSVLNVTEKHDFDMAVRHVSALEYSTVPAYTAVDMRFAWRLGKTAELSLTLQNLFDPGHIEFGNPVTASEVGRSVFLKLLWRP